VIWLLAALLGGFLIVAFFSLVNFIRQKYFSKETQAES